MQRRKIQLIGGTTYSVSLPKEWIKKNNIKQQDEVLFLEKADRTLVISPQSSQKEPPQDIPINVDEYENSIDQILFAAYYFGIEEITLFSNKDLSRTVKRRLRLALKELSGTEITYEDKKKMVIKVFLDREKVDIPLLIYRICLIIELSLSNIFDSIDFENIALNEDEVDRLYHLATKTISLSLTDTSILQSSKIQNVSLIPSYFLVSKKLESLHDYAIKLADYLITSKAKFDHHDKLKLVVAELKRSINSMFDKKQRVFEKLDSEKFYKINASITKIKDTEISYILTLMLRALNDIEDEMVSISFYKKLEYVTI